MQSVIVSVKLQGEDQEYDLEVPAQVPSRKLAELIIHNLDPDNAFKDATTVRCLKPGPVRPLPPDMSLAAAGLWDGVYLEIGPEGAVTDPSWVGILLGWAPLEPEKIAVRPVNTPQVTVTPPSSPASKPAPPFAPQSAPQPVPQPVPQPAPEPAGLQVEWVPLIDDAEPTSERPPGKPVDSDTSLEDAGWKLV